MDEVIKALGPWPLVQGIAIGIIVAAIGFWAMRRGIQESRRRGGEEARPFRLQLTDEEKRQQWRAHEALDHIHENSFAMVKHLETLVEQHHLAIAALNRIADQRWNNKQ